MLEGVILGRWIVLVVDPVLALEDQEVQLVGKFDERVLGVPV